MALTPIGLDNRYPSVARRRHAIGFRHSVNNLGQKASLHEPYFLEVSRPSLVVDSSIPARTQLAYDLTQPDGKPVYSVIAHSQLFSTES